MSDNKTIKEMHPIERPREKLIKYGPEKLSNSELLAILLRTGKKGENVVQMAQKILQKFNYCSYRSFYLFYNKKFKR